MPVPGENVDSRNNGQRNDPSPPHLVADEKHTKRGKEKEFIAVTAVSGCILGASWSTYQKARKSAQKKTGLTVFSENCRYHLKEILDNDWLPE